MSNVGDAKRSIELAKKFNPKLRGIELAVEAIEYDISDRRGLKWEWNAIDEDIKKDIKAVWKKIIKLSQDTK